MHALFDTNVLHEAARHAGAQGIVTRTTSDFTDATLALYTPAELLQAIQQIDPPASDG